MYQLAIVSLSWVTLIRGLDLKVFPTPTIRLLEILEYYRMQAANTSSEGEKESC
jgi:hypothetical protein